MPLTILIPDDTFGRKALGYCGLCDTPFYSDRDVTGHMKSSAHQAQVDIERAAQIAKRERLSIFYDPEAPGSDPEIAEHLKKVGKRMIAENRWELKKSERAGFS